MLSYYDSIEIDNIKLNDDLSDCTATFYLIHLSENNFAIKALQSSVLDAKPPLISNDPGTQAEIYWPLTKEIMLSALEKKDVRAELFPENALRTKPLSREQISEFFGLNPTEDNAKHFDENKDLRQARVRDWAADIMRDRPAEERFNLRDLLPMLEEAELSSEGFEAAIGTVGGCDFYLLSTPCVYCAHF